jgi:TRAP-type C4-dicarboxylate transport system permease small subunit
MQRLNDLYGRLLDGLALIGCLLLFAMMLIICVDVALRNLRWGSLAWSNEVCEYGLYLLVFLAAPWLLRLGSHVRMDMVLKALPPAKAWLLEWVIDLVCLAICTTLAVSGMKILLASHAQGNLVIKTVVFPEWWVLVPLPMTFMLLAIEFLFRMYRLTQGERTLRREATSVA